MKGTPEEQAACRPDVEKYCHDAEPDTFRVLGCLKEQRSRISKKCLAVLESHGQ
jgi:Cysteine rich repeat